ncbi:MAG: phosphatidylserine decarboxylase family protein [Dysgonamonadaceae bacterium]|jgi:phosphatidylserine decarboxylase|nr:phosphatidylserine decarboxylase family protein [Dysgonamonadaceae bacterium]
MNIHKEGYHIIVYCFIILVLVNTTVYYLVGKSLLFYFVLFVSIGLFSLIINFFRRPKCLFKENSENKIVAPADGTIVVIEEVMENEYFRDKRIQVSIFMNVFDAHVNWIPVDGTIIHSSHQNGRFMAAYLPKSSTENERSTIVIQRDNGEQILVRQIAGAVAKRIVTYAKPNQKCRINEQLGFIKFGSRVDLFLPLDSEIKVQLDEKVRGNQTVIAQLRQ